VDSKRKDSLMPAFQFLNGGAVRHPDGRAFLPNDGSADALAYAAWLALGNTTLPIGPIPLKLSDQQPIVSSTVRTISVTPTEILRATVPPNTVYKALLTIWGVTDDMANFRAVEATVFAGRASGNVVVIQTRVSPADASIKVDHALGAGGTWTLPTIAADNTAPGGNQRRDVVIRVIGPANPAVNWLLTGSVETFTLGGVT
jgi:hypothetical protein